MSENQTVNVKMSEKLTIVDLPEILLEMILSFLSYDEIANCRVVCKAFNEKSKQLLNKGSKLMEKSCIEYLSTVKAQLPRRESEKNDHPLLPTCYVLESVKTSFVKLFFTYDKYIQANLCCFIPGKIIDETLKIIRLLKDQEKRGRPLTFTNVQEVLREFNDIKGLAIEHFEETIQPIFERNFKDDVFGVDSKTSGSNDYFNAKMLLAYRSLNKAKSNGRTNDSKNSQYSDYIKKIENQESKMREYINIIEKQELKMKEYAKKIQNQELKMQEYTERMKNQDSKMQEYVGKIRSQDLKMQEYSRKIQNQDAQLAKVTKSLDDLNQKLRSIGFGLIQD